MKKESSGSGDDPNPFEPGDNPYANPCQGTYDPHDFSTAPPHGSAPCGCPRYKGDGTSLCHNKFYDASHDITGTGPGTPNRKCGHPPEHHHSMI